MNVSDFGNYNAGFTGVYSNYRLGIPLIMQWFGAGVFETIKDLKND